MPYCISSDFPSVVTNCYECCSDGMLKYRKNSSSVALMFGLYICSWRSDENAGLDLGMLYSLYILLQFSGLIA